MKKLYFTYVKYLLSCLSGILIFTVSVVFLAVGNPSTCVAQIGTKAHVWQNTLASDSTLQILAIAQRPSLLTYTVRTRRYHAAIKTLYYVDEEQYIEKIYASAFSTDIETFAKTMEYLLPFKLTSIRRYKVGLVYVFEQDKPHHVAFAYTEGAICIFSTDELPSSFTGTYTQEDGF